MAKEEVINQEVETQIPVEVEEEKLNFWQRLRLKIRNNKKKLIIIGLVIVVSLGLAAFLVTSSQRVSQFKPPTFSSPTPTPFEEKITSPSAYATDSAVLEIGDKLKEIDLNLDKTDLKETGINPPVLDLDINFEE